MANGTRSPRLVLLLFTLSALGGSFVHAGEPTLDLNDLAPGNAKDLTQARRSLASDEENNLASESASAPNSDAAQYTGQAPPISAQARPREPVTLPGNGSPR